MLNIYLGKMEEAIYYPRYALTADTRTNGLQKKLSVQMIKDVDKSVVISSRLIDSPVLGPISTRRTVRV